MFDPYIGLIPCGGFPLGEVLVIDLNTQTQIWRKPHGQFPGWLKGIFNAGLPQLGGPLLTRSGVFFIGSAFDSALRAYDVDTGEELWKHTLPAPGAATPMSYAVRDYKAGETVCGDCRRRRGPADRGHIDYSSLCHSRCRRRAQN